MWYFFEGGPLERGDKAFTDGIKLSVQGCMTMLMDKWVMDYENIAGTRSANQKDKNKRCHASGPQKKNLADERNKKRKDERKNKKPVRHAKNAQSSLQSPTLKFLAVPIVW